MPPPEPTEEQEKMLGTYMTEMTTAPLPDIDEPPGEWCRRVVRPILEREKIDHFLCRRCWFEKGGRETAIPWPGCCNECDFEMKWR